MITIEATPEAITIDTAKTVVLVVDMPHDFGAKDAMFDRAGIDLSMIQQAISPTARVLAAAGHGLPSSHHDASLSMIHTLFGWVARSDAFINALERPLIAAVPEPRSRLSPVSINRRLHVSASLTAKRSMIPCRSVSRCSTTGASRMCRPWCNSPSELKR
jgi:hypothetical protein